MGYKKKAKVWQPPKCFVPLYGYKLNPDTKKIKVEPTEALVVKAIFQMTAYGLDEGQIADILNILRLPAPEEVEPCSLKIPENCKYYRICQRE